MGSAGVMMSVVPVLVILLLGQRYLIEEITMDGIKE